MGLALIAMTQLAPAATAQEEIAFEMSPGEVKIVRFDVPVTDLLIGASENADATVLGSPHRNHGKEGRNDDDYSTEGRS
jgi:hypothetical protein